jgi:type IV pilus assembly protein PilM
MRHLLDSKPFLGIDIGTRMTKVLALRSNREQLEIAGAASFENETVITQDGLVQEPKAAGKLIAKHLQSLDLTGVETTFSIPSNMAVLRWLKLPVLDPDELREAARYKVKRHLPFSVDDAFVQATMPDGEGKDGLGNSLVIAVRKHVVTSRAEALYFAGLNPMRAELEAQAILRIIERRLSTTSVLWRDASLTILDVGGSNTHMYVVQNQQLQFIRGVKFGASLIAQAVCDELDIPFATAEAMISDPHALLEEDGYLTLSNEDTRLRIHIGDALEKLTREFLRLLRYFRSLHPERSYAGILDHVVVCGGLSGLEGFCGYLERSLGLRAERAQPIAGTLARLNAETFRSIINRQETFAVVMGLALSGLNDYLGGEGGEDAGKHFAWTRAA